MDFSTFGRFCYPSAAVPSTREKLQGAVSDAAVTKISLQLLDVPKRAPNLPLHLAAATVGPSKSWPPWGRVLLPGEGGSEQSVKFTLRKRTCYNVHRKPGEPDPSDKEFQEAVEMIQQIRDAARNGALEMQNLAEETIRNLTASIYSSNFIEQVGINLRETAALCQKVFSGGDVLAEDIQEDTPEYERQLQALIGETYPSETPIQRLIRARREVVQHAQASLYILSEIVLRNVPLTETLLKETHRLLARGIDNSHPGGTSTPWQTYAGTYRTVQVGAGTTNFYYPRQIPTAMSRMCTAFQQDITVAEEIGVLDPFLLAAKYKHAFVEIHPFEDGNGRVSRLIMNTLLMKYVGVTVAVGGDEEGRRGYLRVQREASENAEAGEALAVGGDEEARGRLVRVLGRVNRTKGEQESDGS